MPGHDADDPAGDAVDADGLPDCTIILREAVAPVSITEDYHLILPFNRVFSREEGAEGRMNLQRVEGIHRDTGAKDTLGRSDSSTWADDVGFGVLTVGREGRKRLRILLKRAYPTLGKQAVGGDGNQPVLIRER